MVQAEGNTKPFLAPEHIDSSILETFDYNPPEIGIKQPIPSQWVSYETDEFSAVCPFSGLPDIATITIQYIPVNHIVELKSLKYYFLSYRDVGIYQEHATQRIFQDIYNLLQPKRLIVTTIYNTRGGIDTTCTIDSLED